MQDCGTLSQFLNEGDMIQCALLFFLSEMMTMTKTVMIFLLFIEMQGK